MIEQLKTDEYPDFFETYLKKVSHANVVESLQESKHDFLTFMENLPSEKINYAYKKGKWTISEVIQHILDTERIFNYRALRFSRNDESNLIGFDQDLFVPNSDAQSRTKEELINDYAAVRNASISLFRSFSLEMLQRKGSVEGNFMSARVAGFIMIGHQKHHLDVIYDRYLGSFDKFLAG